MRAKVLVVAANQYIRETLAIQLRNAGYTVRFAKDGIGAGYEVLENRPDLIISELNLPDVGGLHLVAAMRADPNHSETPVIFLTSGAEAEVKRKDLGPIAYCRKPIRADLLLSVVARMCAETRAAAG